MRRTLLAVLAVALIAGMATSSFAATGVTSLNFPITVTFNGLDIDISVTGTPLATWGQVGASLDYFSNGAAGEIRHTITQNGYLRVDFTASAACTTGWTLANTIGGNTADNTCVVAGIFTEALESGSPSRFLTIADFATNDVLTSTVVTASTTALALDGTGDSEAIKGYDVPNVPGGFATRSMRYVLRTPPTVSGTGTATQTITITIGAIAG